MRYEHHIFVCTNERPADSPRGCCKSKGSEDVLRAFQAQVRDLNLKTTVRANKSGCLDFCENGISVVVYPDAVWYGSVKPEDVPEIMQNHIIGGKPVTRLQPLLKSQESE